MSTTITITFSPCIDRSTSVPQFVPEKKLLCKQARLEPGGGGINVARAIHKLGGNVTAIYPAGGYTGKYLTSLINNEGITSIVQEIAGETRENFIISEEASGNQYRFGMPGTPLDEKEWQQLLDKIMKIDQIDFLVASGSLPPGVPADIFAKLSLIAANKSAKFILDTPGQPLKQGLEAGVYMIKPNLGELCSLVDREKLEPYEVEPAVKKVIAAYNCAVVVVSMGEAGAMLVTKNMTHTFKAPSVARRSTVGAGDSMVAGLIVSLQKGWNIAEAVKYGVACGTAATMNPGTELCRLQDAEHLFRQINSLHQPTTSIHTTCNTTP